MYKIVWVSGSQGGEVGEIFKIIRSSKEDDILNALYIALPDFNKITIEGYDSSRRNKKQIINIFAERDILDICVLRLFNLKRDDDFPCYAIIGEDNEVTFSIGLPENTSGKIIKFK